MAQWANTEILKIERVENGPQMSGSAQPYYESLRKCIEDQGLAFEPGVHTRWAFHGTAAVDSIISNPISGFQPLTSGARVGTVWGAGTYFARDAKYVLDAGFVQPEADGSRRMLVCLLLTGMSCIGDPQHTGVLPHRQKPHHYNSSVDSLNSPEVFIMQHPSSAYPAYVITFK
jgi:poly [ADP-ribose] polymerase 10/14/15